MSPPIDIYADHLVRPFGSARGGSAPPVLKPWQWANCLWTMDSRLAVNDGSARVASVTDRVSPIIWTPASASAKYAYGAGPPVLVKARTADSENIYVDTVGSTPAASFGATSSFTVCFRAYIRWATTVAQNFPLQVFDAAFGISRIASYRRNGLTPNFTWDMTFRDAGTTSSYTLAGPGIVPPLSAWQTWGFRSRGGTDFDFWLNGVQVKTSAVAFPVRATLSRMSIYDVLATTSGNDWGVNAGFSRALSDTEMLDWHTYFAAIFF